MDPFVLDTAHLAAPRARSRPVATEEYLRALHPAGSRGKVTLMAMHGSSTSSRCMGAEEAAAVADVWAEAQSFLSLNRFHGPRRVDRLAVLNALYVDLDVYKEPHFSLPRHEIARLLGLHLAATGLPDPSYIVDSGRGFYVVYLIDPCPARALPRWTAAQRCLVDLLKPFGADAACVDAARVLRLPGTVNPRARAVVTVVEGTGVRYGIDGLADAIFRACGRPTRTQLRERKAGTASPGTGRGLHPRDRFAAVLRDLESIRAAWGGSIPEGIRNIWLHLAVTGLTFTVAPDEIVPEAMRLAAIATPGLPPSEVRATAKAAVARAEAVSGGYLGPDRDPRLNYSGERMCEVLGVSRVMAEALALEQIIPQVLRTERRNARRREKRQKGGGLSREEYLAQNPASREKPWETLGIGRSVYYERTRAGLV